MVGGTTPPQSDSGEISRVLVLNLLWQSKRCSRTAQDISVLTTPSLLSRGTKLSSRSLCQHERGRSRLTSSGTESRGQEGSAPHVRTGLSTADSSRLKPLGVTMRKGSCSAPFGLAQG